MVSSSKEEGVNIDRPSRQMINVFIFPFFLAQKTRKDRNRFRKFKIHSTSTMARGETTGGRGDEIRDGILPKILILYGTYYLAHSFDAIAYPAIITRLCDGDEGKAALVNAAGHAIYYGFAFVLLGAWGTVSDRLGRRPVMAACFAAEIVGHLVVLLHPSIQTYLLSQLAGAASTVLPAAHAAATDISDRDTLSHSFGQFGLALGLAFVAGPIVGAVLFSVHWWLPVLTTLVLHVIGVVFTLTVLPETLNLKTKSIIVPSNRTLRPGLRWWLLESDVSPIRSVVIVVRLSPLLTILLVPYALWQLASSSTSIFLYYLSFRYNASVVFVGALLSGLGVAVAIFQGFGLKHLVPGHISQRDGVLIGCIGQILLLFILATAPTRNSLFFLVLAIPAYGLQDPCVRADLAKCLPDEHQGALNGALFSIRAAAQTASYFFSWLFVVGKKKNGSASALPFFVAIAMVAVATALFKAVFAYDDMAPNQKMSSDSGRKLLLVDDTSSGTELGHYELPDVRPPSHHRASSSSGDLLSSSSSSSSSGYVAPPGLEVQCHNHTDLV